MLARAPAMGQVVRARQAVHEVVRGQDRILADLAQPRATVGADIGVRAHEDAGVADSNCAVGRSTSVAPRGVPGGRSRRWREGRVASGGGRSVSRRRPDRHPDHPRRAASRTSCALKCITSKPASPAQAAEDRVEVRAVHVGERADLVDRLEQLANALLEQAERRGVRDHHRGRPWTECRAECIDVHSAVGSRWDRDRPVAGHRCRGGVCAMARVRHEHVAPLGVAAATVMGADHEDPGQLAGHRPPAGATPRASR